MNSSLGKDAIADHEIVLRRLPGNANYYDPTSEPPVKWVAFKPNKLDSSGISVWRSKYITPDEILRSHCWPGRTYYFVELRVADLRALGLDVIPTPEEGGPAHGSIPQLSAVRYKESRMEVMELASRVACEICQSINGPFVAPVDP